LSFDAIVVNEVFGVIDIDRNVGVIVLKIDSICIIVVVDG
jgi:hypothetical protein